MNNVWDSKRLQSALIAILSVVFLEGFNTPLTAQTVFVGLAGFAYLALNYSVEDALRKFRRQGEGAVQRLWQSKRFWVVLAGTISTIMTDLTNVSYSVEMVGLNWTIWSALLLLIVSVVTGISLEDFAEATEKRQAQATVKQPPEGVPG